MAINAIGSGLDIPSLVESLVAAQKNPAAARISNAGTAATSKLTAIGQVKSSLTSLQTALKNLSSAADAPGYKATVPTDAGFTASASSKAVPGSYSVEVVKLATAQKVSSQAYAADAKVGSGTLTFTYGDDKTLVVDISGASTVTEIAAAINKAAKGSGVTAGVVTSNDGQHLVLSAMNTGESGAFSVAASGGDGGLDALTYAAGGTSAMNLVVAAEDAVVRVDGFERKSSSNTVADLVPGVTLTLTKAAEGSKTTLGIASDNTSLKSTITAFVTAYNATNTTLKNVSAFNTTTQASSALTGDSLVRNMQQQLRGEISANVTEFKALGLTIDKDGVLSFNSTTFDTAIGKDPGAVASLFGKSGGYATGMTTLLTSHLDGISGTLTQRTTSLNKQIKGLEGDLDDLDVRMKKMSDRYTAQFSAMEAMIVQLQSSASSLNSLLTSST